jgi:thiamine biosynthesis protein ThiI
METYLAKVGELTLKGSNLHIFERLLILNTRQYLLSVESKVSLTAGRLYIECPPESCAAAEYALNHLIGITGWAHATVCEKDISAIQKAAYDEAVKAKNEGACSFKIEAKRSDKSFPLDSYGICAKAADTIYDSSLLSVDVHNPDVTITVEIRERCFVYSDRNSGCRGLPVGSSGKGLLLLSGGLDSPVAGYRMMRRGMKVECCYFHSYPYTSEQAQEKVEKLASIIGDYGIDTHLNIIPFTDVQMRIKERAPENASTLLLRVCMMKCANLLAERINADALITGESLGQVASQTIANMTVTEHYAKYPVLRPLSGLDKEEIIDTAKQINTYDTSILPYEDCCVLFSPRHPVLHGSISESDEALAKLDIDDLIRDAFEKRVIKRYSCSGSVAAQFGTNDKKDALAAENEKTIS